MLDIILEIPLLRELIVLGLTLKDIKDCTLVSKQWNDWFTPNLWRTVNTNHYFNKSYDDLTALLFRYPQLVQSINSTHANGYPAVLPIFPNLQSLNLAGSANIDTLLDRFSLESATLRKIVLSRIFSENEESIVRLLDALKRATSLNHLELRFICPVEPTLIKDLIFNHANIETFQLQCGSRDRDGISEEYLRSVRDAIYQLKDPRLKNLHFGICTRQQYETFLCPLLQQSKRVETLTLTTFDKIGDLKPVTRILKEGNHGRLKNISFEGNWSSTEDWSELFSELGKVNCQTNANGSRKTAGVNSIRFPRFRITFNRVNFQPTIQSLIRYFSGTLTHLYLENNLIFEHIADLLSGLPLLQSFIGGHCGTATDGDALLRIRNSPWTCLQMNELEISLDIFNEMDGPNFYRLWKGSANEKTAEYFFTQLGRLTNLRKLKFGANGSCLNLAYGFLEYLPNLRELRTLDLSEYTRKRSAPSPMEAEWMMDHWLKLETICFPRSMTKNLSPSNPDHQKLIRNLASDVIREIRPDMIMKVGYGYQGDFYHIE